MTRRVCVTLTMLDDVSAGSPIAYRGCGMADSVGDLDAGEVHLDNELA